MGLVTAGKFAGEGFVGFVEVTVMVRSAGTKQVEVRVNALYNTKPIEDPKVYQNFFATVEKSLFVVHSKTVGRIIKNKPNERRRPAKTWGRRK